MINSSPVCTPKLGELIVSLRVSMIGVMLYTEHHILFLIPQGEETCNMWKVDVASISQYLV